MINHVELRSEWEEMISKGQYKFVPKLERFMNTDLYIGLSRPMYPLIAFRGHFPGTSFAQKEKIGCLLFEIRGNNKTEDNFFVIECCNSEYLRLFEYFAAALLAELDAHEGMPEDIIDVILDFSESWRSVFQKERDSKELGLFGELYFFKRIHELRPDLPIIWNYPKPSTKDFTCGEDYFEVKTTSKRNVDIVEIHGIDQLMYPPGSQLYLPFIRVESICGGMYSFDRLISDIGKSNFNYEQRKKIERITTRAEALEYNVLEAKVFKVSDQFPRIQRDDLNKIVNGSCIANVTYTIDLTGLPSIPLDQFIESIGS